VVETYPGVRFLTTDRNVPHQNVGLDIDFYSELRTQRLYNLTGRDRGQPRVPPTSPMTDLQRMNLPVPERIVFTESSISTLFTSDRMSRQLQTCPFCMLLLPFLSLGWPMIYQGQEFMSSKGSLLAFHDPLHLYVPPPSSPAVDFSENDIGYPPTTTSIQSAAADSDERKRWDFMQKYREFCHLYTNRSLGLSGAYMNIYQNCSCFVSVRKWHGSAIPNAEQHVDYWLMNMCDNTGLQPTDALYRTGFDYVSFEVDLDDVGRDFQVGYFRV
jgi:hypothetical protein